MKVSEVMTSAPACCDKTQTAQDAARIMADLDVGVIPIVELEGKTLAGVVTDRDLCLQVIAQGKNPSEVKLEECMTAEVISCNSVDDLEDVMGLMQEHQLKRIMVVNDDNRIEGVVSLSDIALCTEDSADEVGQTVQSISEPTNQQGL